MFFLSHSKRLLYLGQLVSNTDDSGEGVIGGAGSDLAAGAQRCCPGSLRDEDAQGNEEQRTGIQPASWKDQQAEQERQNGAKSSVAAACGSRGGFGTSDTCHVLLPTTE
ncbi:hypothetical protein Bbelb_439610 [Branchiostoma belcheri]|nr:hypothetical protein Bbelb_439890 [Branchiostoma belcheri]KAI8478311.1 hypothetical protein Bbelb_439610 [Branchiostoma belcheri]